MAEPAKPVETPPVENPPPENPPPPAPAPAAPPPAATAVANGKTERELQLEKELEETRAGKKKAETDAAEKEDQLVQLKKLQTEKPKPKKESKRRLTFFDSEED